MKNYLQRAHDRLDDIIEIRRDIHAHPELGFEETRTSELVKSKLLSWGVEVEHSIGKTGLVGTIHGQRAGNRAIGLRADMDALAMKETNNLPHASQHAGRMHGCGHDGHTAMLLGAARALAEDRDFEGKVHLIFQPAEEGRGGALAMLEDQLFERFPCDRIFGLHSFPSISLGHFGMRAGAMMAASGRWQVTFRGAGGHGGAFPHLTADLAVAQANFVLGLQTIISRNVPATESAIVSVGHISAGDPNAMNVMPSELLISGTMRAFSPAVQTLLESKIKALAKAHAELAGAKVEVKLWWNSAPVINDDDAFASAARAAARVTDGQAVDLDIAPTTGGEDFSWMMQKRPGAFMLIGNGRRLGDGGGDLHMPNYDFNDKAIPYGIAYWLSVVDEELGSRK
ncbi:amidohydrolase [Ottowia thiooxydans]|uniref:Amidohydrolase n=1 Tax=Ottowia thiooxydans TaxID=219182 RepID=A0ABV2Q219_9BURK